MTFVVEYSDSVHTGLKHFHCSCVVLQVCAHHVTDVQTASIVVLSLLRSELQKSHKWFPHVRLAESKDALDNILSVTIRKHHTLLDCRLPLNEGKEELAERPTLLGDIVEIGVRAEDGSYKCLASGPAGTSDGVMTPRKASEIWFNVERGWLKRVSKNTTRRQVVDICAKIINREKKRKHVKISILFPRSRTEVKTGKLSKSTSCG